MRHRGAPLLKIQRKACLTILRPVPTTPTMGMELILNIRPIDIHIKGLALNSYRRMKQNGYWRPQIGELHKKTNHSNIITNIARGLKLITKETDVL